MIPLEIIPQVKTSGQELVGLGTRGAGIAITFTTIIRRGDRARRDCRDSL